MTVHKVRVNQARRVAKRRGFVLNKSRRRDPQALDYGIYQLRDARDREVASGSLNDIEEWLKNYVRK